ncbi:MAG: DUF2341 domain-containing protein, partial [Candidatus Bathyarchaeota archaeon]|nr:DUF2341 domain-containing protein [Candidatus Bathyarchaeota archaeon]
MGLRNRRGQVLVIAALAIALTLLSTQAYIYNLSHTKASSPYSLLSDYILGIEQGSEHVVTASLIEGGWLDEWDQRVNITIDHDDVDSDLPGFPVLIYLSGSSGRNDYDMTFIFDELQSDANRKRIAVTTSDGTTQCYVEIEEWDDAGEEAWLWVKVPTVDSSADTVLYLYYDANHTDNAGYVGDSGSATARNVWDDDYVGVWHLPEDPEGAAPQMKNSKSDNHHGSCQGFMDAFDQVRGQIDGSLDLDGFNDYIDFGSSEDLDITGDITIEFWLKADDYSGFPDIVTKGTFDESYSVWLESDGDIVFSLNNDRLTSLTNVSTTYWNYIAVTRIGSDRRVFINGTEDASDVYAASIGPVVDPLTVSSDVDSFDGIVDDARLSDTGRVAPWIKACYESGVDDLVAYGSVETKTEYYREGFSSNLNGYLGRWEQFVGGEYRFGLCELNATVFDQAPYTDGIWLDWGADGVGRSSAAVDLTLNVSGRGVEVDWGFSANTTTTVEVSGSYVQA